MSLTPTPWKILPADRERIVSIVIAGDGYHVCSVPVTAKADLPTNEADAEHIVKCVNLHDELLAALREYVSASTLYDLDRAQANGRAILAKVSA